MEYADKENKSVWTEQPCKDQMKRLYYRQDGTVLTKEGGSVSWRNNNEGNLRPGSLSSNRIGVDKKNFAIFATPEEGREAKKNLLFNSSSYKDLTLRDAIKKYAPASDNNNPTQYANTILNRGKLENKVMSKYTDEEREMIMSIMKTVEGYRVGNETITKFKSLVKSSDTFESYNKREAVAYNKTLQYSKTDWKGIQEKINKLGYYNLTVDGLPGVLTADAIQDIQQKNNIPANGKLDNETKKLIK